MSGLMKITFDRGLPPVAVEVLAPDFSTVASFSQKGSEVREVRVPSEASFLRVHLPSGRTVILRHPGQLNYRIDREVLSGRPARPPTSIGRKFVSRPKPTAEKSGESRVDYGGPFMRRFSPGGPLAMAPTPSDELIELSDGVQVRCSQPMRTRVVSDRGKITLRREHDQLDKHGVNWMGIQTPMGRFNVRLPGNLKEARLEVDEGNIALKIASEQPMADAINAYLTQANYGAANAMAEQLREAQFMLAEKLEDPFAAAVGAYLLLRLERYDMLRDWPRNLANWFPELADGAVIWGCQQLTQKDTYPEAAGWLLQAAQRELPIYTEGLRLLIAGLGQIGEKGRPAQNEISGRVGRILWDSPLTAYFKPEPGADFTRRKFKISYFTLP